MFFYFVNFPINDYNHYCVIIFFNKHCSKLVIFLLLL